MTALVSLNNIAWKTGVHLFQDLGELARKFRGMNKTGIMPYKMECTRLHTQEKYSEKNFIQKDPRLEKRVAIALPVSLNNRKCITHDFSETGVFIVTETPYKNGEQIKFAISVDQLLNKLILKCTGKIVRAGEIQGKVGFAVKIATHVLESEKDSDLHSLRQ